MANPFTPSLSRRSAGPVDKSVALVQGTLVIDTTASGGASADDLPASMFGLNKIIACLGITKDSEDKLYFAHADATGDSLLVGGGASAATQDLPNGTYIMEVIGY